MTQVGSQPNSRVTVDEFYDLVDDRDKADLIHGVIWIEPSDTLRNNEVTWLVICLLRGYADVNVPEAIVTGFRYTFELSKYCALEPDVA